MNYAKFCYAYAAWTWIDFAMLRIPILRSRMNGIRTENFWRHAKAHRIHLSMVIPWASDSWQPRRRLLLGLTMWNPEPAFTRGHPPTIVTKLLYLKMLLACKPSLSHVFSGVLCWRSSLKNLHLCFIMLLYAIVLLWKIHCSPSILLKISSFRKLWKLLILYIMYINMQFSIHMAFRLFKIKTDQSKFVEEIFQWIFTIFF